MLEKLKAYIERLNHNDAKDRGPVAPNRVPTRPVTRRPDPEPTLPAGARNAAAQPDSEMKPRILSRGNGKNVYVVADPDADEDELLRIVDMTDDGLSIAEPVGSDPYNSGIRRRQNVWNTR